MEPVLDVWPTNYAPPSPSKNQQYSYDLLHSLSNIPRGLNFIEHTSDIGWKEHERARPVIIDPGLYSLQKSDVFWVSQKRSVPTAFKLFTGRWEGWKIFGFAIFSLDLCKPPLPPRTPKVYHEDFGSHQSQVLDDIFASQMQQLLGNSL